MKKVLLITAVFFMFCLAQNALAVNFGDTVNFFVDQQYDASARSSVTAVLVRTTPNIYFYVEKSWWDQQLPQKQQEVLHTLDSLSSEFTNRIYPILTSQFGSEWRPGVDGDYKITVFFHLTKDDANGYFRSPDEYLKLQVPDSNEREMIYLSLKQIDNLDRLKVMLAHEFTHLVTFNQKEKENDMAEEVWLNEARAEYVSTLLGYNNSYEGSNLQARVKDFLEKPNDSLTEWQGLRSDYGVINLFFHYLVDHYGISILSDSMKSKLVGIASINEALQKNGYHEDFKQIFTDWTITLAVNNCSDQSAYCYLNANLSAFRVTPTLVFLPLSGESSLSSTVITKYWSGNWQKIVGGSGDLKLEFSSLEGLNFSVPYILFDKRNNYTIHFLSLGKDQRGEVTVPDFDTKYSSLVIIPSLQTNASNFTDFEFTYPYTITVSASGTSQDNQDVIQKLLQKIEDLKRQIAELKLQLGRPSGIGDQCSAFSQNLYLGLSNGDVRCLQQFLVSEGTDIYPEGLTTGYFGNLTKSAVMRFQQKYHLPSTGFVGILTRAKINELLQS